MSIVEHAPNLDLNSAKKFAKEVYGLDADATPLPSERDQNFLLRTTGGEKFVLKVANATEERALLEAQNQTMGHLEQSIDFCPRVISSTNGHDIELASATDDTRHFTRLVTYLPGTPLGKVHRRTSSLLNDLGRKIGQVSLALQTFDHPALHRDFHWDLACGLKIIRQNEKLIADNDLRSLATRFADGFEKGTLPLLPYLRTSIIHNDANDYNILVGGGTDHYTRNQTVTGLIDFGDMVHSYTIGDLALAIAYAVLDQPDPLATAAHITRGYHFIFPPTEEEITCLFELVILRLCMSVAIAAEQQNRKPDNDYLGISQQAIRRSLPELMKIPTRHAEAVLREACGLPPAKNNQAIIRWLQKHADEFGPLLDHDIRTHPLILDLSVGSPLLSSDPTQNEELNLTPRISDVMKQSGGKVAIGQYDEARYLYTSPAFATGSGPTDEARTVHLGIDLFAEAGTPVHAPMEGTVLAFTDNAMLQDYGPVMVLVHHIDSGEVFYTLYGHLSRESLAELNIGQAIKKNQKLAEIGSTEVNGGWTPHLHFQVITDLLGLGTDFPGVAQPSQREVWKSLCPDPNLILGIPQSAFPQKAPAKAKTLADRRERLGRNLSIAYREPVKVVRGWKQYLFDDEGRCYIDAYNNVAHVGHAHPRVVEAGRRQMGVLNTNTRYLHDLINRYALRLTSLLPDPLRVCYFVNSGSEANELALRLARTYTGHRDLIVLEAAYHGNTTALIDISPYKHNGPGGNGAPDWVHAVPIPDDYRGLYKRNDLQAGVKYAGTIAGTITKIKTQGRGLAGFIAESFPSVGGQIILPPGYLAEVYRHVHASGGVCIADEVQTGFGRIGTHFWGFEPQGIVPDIVVLGKPIGNGHPIGAVITTPTIADAFNNGMEYFSTFGGNPVSCAIGLEVLDVVHDEGLQDHALRVGARMLDGLRPLVEKYPLVGDVRGSGLFLGVELVRDRSTLEPAAEEASFVVNRLREQGILLGTDGPYHNVVKIRPPMPFDESNGDFLVTTFEKILMEDF